MDKDQRKIVRIGNTIKIENNSDLNITIINKLKEKNSKLYIKKQVLESKRENLEGKYLLEKTKLEKESIDIKFKISGIKQVISILEKVKIF